MIRKTLEIRFIGEKSAIELMIAAMYDRLKRNGYQLAKEPYYKQSQKKQTDTIAYTEWIINENTNQS